MYLRWTLSTTAIPFPCAEQHTLPVHKVSMGSGPTTDSCVRSVVARFGLANPCLISAWALRTVIRIVLVIGTVISDAANHFIGVVTASEGTLGEGTVPFRLGYLAFGSDATPSVCDEVFSAFVVIVTSESEILRPVCGNCFTAAGHDVRLCVLSVHKRGQAQNASRIRGRQIGVELSRQSPLEVRGFVQADGLDVPALGSA